MDFTAIDDTSVSSKNSLLDHLLRRSTVLSMVLSASGVGSPVSNCGVDCLTIAIIASARLGVEHLSSYETHAMPNKFQAVMSLP